MIAPLLLEILNTAQYELGVLEDPDDSNSGLTGIDPDRFS